MVADPMHGRGGEQRGNGFTLVETLIALVLSSFVIGLVSHTFLVQNRYYATQTLQTGAQDNVRAATELMAREVRNAAEDGMVVAGARTLTLRSPMAIGVFCNRLALPQGDVMTEGGQAGLDTVEVAGLAIRNSTTWEYSNASWSSINGNDVNSATGCADNGADTVGAINNFHRLRQLNLLFGTVPGEGDVVMIFRETTFKIQTSQLDTTTYGLFRGSYGEPLVEFATGIDTTAQFQYRTGGTTYADTVVAGSLGSIDAVRIVADARMHSATGGDEAVTFGWSVNVALRNIR